MLTDIIVNNQIINYLKFFKILLIIFPGSTLIDYLSNPQKYWNIMFNIVLKNNKIIYVNEKIASKINKGYIIVANHVHATDVLLIRNKINCYAISKSSLISKGFPSLKPIEKSFFNNLSLIPYKRNCLESGDKVKKKILRLIKSGSNVLVFPEGTSQMNSHNKMFPFRKGLFYLAFENNIPILPVNLYYTDTKYGLDKGTPLDIFGVFNNNCKIIVHFSEPVHANNFNNVDKFVDNIYTHMTNVTKMYNNKLKKQSK